MFSCRSSPRKSNGLSDVVRSLRITAEALEQRTLLSVVVHGTPGDDTISVSLGAGNSLIVDVNGAQTAYSAAQFAGGISIDTGGSRSAGDSLTILGLPAVQTTAVGEGLLKATVGSASRGLADISATSLKLGGATGTLQLTVNDSADATARHLTLGTANESGVTYDVLHGLTPGDIRAAGTLLVVNLGNAGNTIDVTGTAPAPNPLPTFAVVNLNTGNGDDTVNVSAGGWRCDLSARRFPPEYRGRSPRR